MTRHDPAHEIELYRDDDAYVVYGDLPGYDSEQIEVRWHDRRLHLSAERYDADADRRLVFHRTVGVPHDIDDELISAIYDEGVLEVRLPIVDGSEKPGKRIEITTR